MMNNDYLIYINNNNLLTNCQKKTLINYNNLKFKFYIETNSNYQINFLFNNIYKNNNIEEIARFELLLLHFTDYNTLKYIIRQSLKNKITDTNVINIIKKNLNKHFRIKNIYEICNKWIYAIESLLLIYNNNNNNNNINYLDIGCGDAKKTQIFAKKLNLKNDNIYCTDIQEWGPYQIDKKNIPFQFEYIIDNKLNYSDNKFNLVTCILTLHHITDLDNFLTEIYRVVKPDGYLLVIEHSVYTDYDRLLINIQHLLYSALHDKKIDYIKNPDYINCYNSYEFHHMMNKKKFILTHSNVLVFNNEFKLKYDNIFYAFYKK